MIICWGVLPHEVRAAVRPLLLDYLWVVPPWVREIGVRYTTVHRSGNEGAAGSSTANEPYRWATVWLHARWLEDAERERRLDLIHELLHIPLQPMVQEHSNVIDTLLPDGESPKLRATLEENWRQRFEGSTQDLAHAIASLPGPFPAVPFTEEEDP